MKLRQPFGLPIPAALVLALGSAALPPLSGCGEGHKTGDRAHEEYPEAAQAKKSMEDFMKNKPASSGPVKVETDMEKFMKRKTGGR